MSLPYEGTIRKRLRLKGYEPIPPAPDERPLSPKVAPAADPDAMPSSSGHLRSVGDDADDDRDIIRPAERDQRDGDGDGDGGGGGDSDGDARRGADIPAAPDNARAQGTGRTDAERRHDEKLQLREQDALRREAAKSYREKVQDFNKRLAEEPEHYDLFKTSFTK